MSVGRYLIINASDAERCRAIAHSAKAFVSKRARMRAFGSALVISADLPVVPSAKQETLTIGHAFPWTGLERVDDVPDFRNWGSYIHLSDGPPGIALTRDPSGMLPCYVRHCDGVSLAASDAKLLTCTGTAEIDWPCLAGFLATGGMRSRATCLAGIFEPVPGTRQQLAADNAPETLWSPWTFTTAKSRIPSEAAAAETLRRTINQVAEAWAAQFPDVVLGVSGGLDSSIVAAALKCAGANITAVTLATRERDGDERAYARALTDALGIPLVEAFEDPDHVDLEYSAAAHLPRPSTRAFSQSSDAIQLAIASERRATAFMSGGGGDSVFCALRSASPLADRILAKAGLVDLARTARDIGSLTGSPLWPVLVRGVRNAWRGVRPLPPLANPFLSRDCRAAVTALPLHPWLAPPAGTSPGKAAHIAWILGIFNHLDPVGRTLQLPGIFPLMAQPVVELCLRIPTWMWVSGGRDRAVAREAFRDILPKVVLERRSKGTPASFVMTLFETRRSQIREMLCDGLLAHNGLIDRTAVAHYARDPRPVSDVRYMQVMSLVDAESWARCWTDQEAPCTPF